MIDLQKLQDQDEDQRPANSDAGFTLIEVLIVVMTMAILATAIAATLTVALRTSPPADERADDARSLQGLVTWIPEDVDAAPPDGFDTATTAWPCSGAAPSNSYNLLSVTWQERTTVTLNFASTYRYEFDGSDWSIVRYTCDDLATAPAMSSGIRLNLTSTLPPWNNLAPPASVTMCDTQVDNNGDCPPGNIITTNTSPDVESLKLRITRLDGVVSTIDAAPKNPDQDLSGDPNASTNTTPTVSQLNYVLEMYAGDTVTVDLNATHSPFDADGDTLSVAIDSTEPTPPGVTATTADPLDVTFTTDASLPNGMIPTPLTLIISDSRAGWVDATINVKIISPVNLPPQVSPAIYALQLTAGQVVVLPLDVTHGAFDPNGDPMTVSVVSYPNEVFAPSVGAPFGPLEVEIRAKMSVWSGPTLTPIVLTIQDGLGGVVTATVTVEMVAATANSAPTVTTSNVGISMLAGDSVTMSLDTSHGASDPDSDPISASIDTSQGQPAGITTTAGPGLSVTIVADPTIVAGPVAVPVSLLVKDTSGASVAATVTITIDPTPPPPSNCVLGGVSASPNPVDRQGNGNGARHLKNDVTVTLTYTGSCDGLVLRYDTGDTSGLGIGTGRVFPPGSPSKIVMYANGNGGTEKWNSGSFVLTASTTSAVTPNSITTTLVVN